ncbi:hypothetical protein DPMN_016379 [Dreissena polymorpha]|uniref:Uncharacterized protein n=1 Tax=Dreissena polymorpha TaxID=45954 RepID=A0A9D4NEQ4_DREPO|nr:hypothetical protein DPMN_016379 [Dreissena polymorpha]
MLLGFDILVNTGKAILNMAEATLIFDGQVLSLNLGSTDGQPRVAEVRVGKRRVIPPNSVVKVKCNMSKFETDYVVESFGNSKLLVPRVVLSAGSDPVLCLLNPTDRVQLVKKNFLIARAYPVAEYLSNDSATPDSGGCRVQACSLVDPVMMKALPEHIRDLYERSEEHLNELERKQLADLLTEYQDVFARDEFDMGNFTAISHTIDTRYRKRPTCHRAYAADTRHVCKGGGVTS